MSVQDLIPLMHPKLQAYIRELESYRKVREPDYSKTHTALADLAKGSDKPYFHYNKNGEKVVYMGPKVVLFLDMDGVLAHFEANLKEIIWNPPEMFEEHFFLKLPVNPGAKEFVEWALKQPYLDVCIATKPLTTGMLWSATEKMQWVKLHFPELLEKMMIVADKGYLVGDVLADDDKRWEDKFKGEFFHIDKFNTAESFRKLREKLEKRD